MKKIVVALGGNAILTDDASAEAQQRALVNTADQLLSLTKQGYKLIVTHGNGPQVGNLFLQQQAVDSNKNPAMPLDTCVAMTQGSIGYWLSQALTNASKKSFLGIKVASLLTTVVVSPEDPAFEAPTKPIGPFYTEDEAKMKASNCEGKYIEDSGRGYRKDVPSPKPIDIVESDAVKAMIYAGFVTVCAGGGGIPVIRGKEGYEGVEAVIDKDFASAKLADLIEADQLVILTGVDNVFINYNKPNQKKLERISVSELELYIQEGHFAPGSMLPKVEAALAFVNSAKGREAIITSLENIVNIKNDVGTIVYKD
ncbi:MAG TPA: carbamate kinase [Fusibacter sp.]|nr:carbamate kinase [Fusibacter sp.]